MMPALLISTSTASIESANARTEDRSCRSSLRTSTCPGIPAAAALPFSRLRTATITVAPTLASSLAVTSPRPLLAPVTMTVRPANVGRWAAVQSLMRRSVGLDRTLLLGDGEALDDRLDVGPVGLRLVGEGG